MLGAILLMAQLVTPIPLMPGSNELYHVNWQSCLIDGEYVERIADHISVRNGHAFNDWSLHLGPYLEFALYHPEEDPTRLNGDSVEHSHAGPTNLLGPAYTVEVEGWRGKRTWTVPSLHLWVNVVMAGGSRDNCMSFLVLVRKQ